jgi:hypothetical protein
MKMGSWHNFSRHKIYQCRVKKEFRILPMTRWNWPLSAVGEEDGDAFSAKGEARKTPSAIDFARPMPL